MKKIKVCLVDAFVYGTFIGKLQMDFETYFTELEALKTWS